MFWRNSLEPSSSSDKWNKQSLKAKASVVWISSVRREQPAEPPPQQWPGTSVLLSWCSLARSAVVWRLLLISAPTPSSLFTGFSRPKRTLSVSAQDLFFSPETKRHMSTGPLHTHCPRVSHISAQAQTRTSGRAAEKKLAAQIQYKFKGSSRRSDLEARLIWC